ncbi:AP-1 complex subunit sigma-2-like [Branchiostoma floridae x Branchiostoma japonicum]
MSPEFRRKGNNGQNYPVYYGEHVLGGGVISLWCRHQNLCTPRWIVGNYCISVDVRGSTQQVVKMMKFMLLFSRQGKVRLQQWYSATQEKEKKKIMRELITIILARKPKMCSFLEWKEYKIVYKRYASLYFCCAIEKGDNELLTLEIIHRYVELLDKYFGSVCELDIIFNFEKAYFILDELMLGGEIQETSKKNCLKAIAAQDLLQEEADATRNVLEEMGLP